VSLRSALGAGRRGRRCDRPIRQGKSECKLQAGAGACVGMCRKLKLPGRARAVCYANCSIASNGPFNFTTVELPLLEIGPVLWTVAVRPLASDPGVGAAFYRFINSTKCTAQTYAHTVDRT
jgi:hypothetical protein